jgi:hypothetical protein
VTVSPASDTDFSAIRVVGAKVFPLESRAVLWGGGRVYT